MKNFTKDDFLSGKVNLHIHSTFSDGKADFKSILENAKSQGADMIVASVHWGTEYSTTPNDEQNELADFLFQNGVNNVV